jgi:hypothetical protein
LIFAGGHMGDRSGHLISIIHNAQESGYRWIEYLHTGRVVAAYSAEFLTPVVTLLPVVNKTLPLKIMLDFNQQSSTNFSYFPFWKK